MSQDNPAKPKIIVDSDWKAQAEREKEQLSAKLGEDKKPERAAQAPAADQGQAPQMPKADFLTHCASVATQAMIFMGAIRHPMTNEVEFDPIQARYLIDTLQMLKDKTRGNLDAKETQAVDDMLGELKMVWVQVIQELQRQQAAAISKGTKA
ncbi:MAG: DUF1844 domain-containing protein [Planctomycetes bacterium]|jgi:hypothetical protein|nr:DUF1844 domain-containing protein [Planctomycetota bacterium]MCL4730497.1 DUF1844 domain-containing protein [Planctomycetota bacterium]